MGTGMLINQILDLDGGIFESERPLSPPQSESAKCRGKRGQGKERQ
jgi:hypothetical protein